VFKPSKYQQRVFDFIQQERGNAVISAVAGSGKTTTIVNALTLLPTDKKILFLAFNKHIVEELRPKVPPFVEVSTLHSLGWRYLKSRYHSAKLEDKKLQRLFWDVMSPKWELAQFTRQFKDAKTTSYNYGQTLMKMVNLMKMTNDPSEKGMMDIMAKHLILPVTGMELIHAKALFNNSVSNKQTFDFSDMLYVPLKEELFPRVYDFVFVDEAQDLNRIQIEIARNILKPRSGRLIAVGDPYQSIYGFAGADPESYNILKNLPDTVELPLSICYRCAKSIVKHAQTIVPHIQESETQIDGEVVIAGTLNPQTRDWVICRNNSPLVTLYFQLIGNGRIAIIRGSDIGRELITEIEKISPSFPQDIFDYFDKLISNLHSTMSRVGNDEVLRVKILNQIDGAEEKCKIYRSVLNGISSGGSTTEKTRYDRAYVSKMTEEIERMFSDNVEGIVLSTAHKSKGLEADNVFIIRPDLFPSKHASLPWQIQQEKNLLYVAVTRAKKTLTIVPKSNWDDTKINKAKTRELDESTS